MSNMVSASAKKAAPPKPTAGKPAVREKPPPLDVAAPVVTSEEKDASDQPGASDTGPATPETSPAVEILRKQKSERGMDLEAVFNTSGVPVMLHKFRKALLGGVGALIYQLSFPLPCLTTPARAPRGSRKTACAPPASARSDNPAHSTTRPCSVYVQPPLGTEKVAWNRAV